MFERVDRILMVKPSALGDIVHSLPVLAALHDQFPGARIDWVVAHGLHRFLEGHPLIHRLWVIKKDEWKKPDRLGKSIREILALRKGLKQQQYDVCIDLSGLLRSGLISWFSGAPVRLGFKEGDEGSPLFYTHKIHGSMDIHAIDRYLEIPRFMGARPGPVQYPFAPFDPDPPLMKTLPESYCIICPSAGKAANRWPADRYGALAAQLPLPCLVIASAGEASVADAVVAGSRGNARSLAGQTGLKELIPLIQKARFFVCNDTGPMHIAAALEVPVFAIFGPANPIRTGPYGRIHTVIRKDLPCSPCYAQKSCSHFSCMLDITADQVFSTIRQSQGRLFDTGRPGREGP